MKRIKEIKYTSTKLFAEDSGKNIIVNTSRSNNSFTITLPEPLKGLEFNIYCFYSMPSTSSLLITGGKNIPLKGSIKTIDESGAAEIISTSPDTNTLSINDELVAGSWFKFIAINDKWYITGTINRKDKTYDTIKFI